MALILSQTYKGLIASYWKILSSKEDYTSGTTEIVIALYYNKDARLLDIDNKLIVETYTLASVDQTREEQYESLKLGEYSPISFRGPGTNKFSLAEDN